MIYLKTPSIDRKYNLPPQNPLNKKYLLAATCAHVQDIHTQDPIAFQMASPTAVDSHRETKKHAQIWAGGPNVSVGTKAKLHAIP
jgi:hypothetical protein